VKILPVILFRKLVPAFRYHLVTVKVVPKAAFDPEKCADAGCECTLHGENRPMREKDWNRNLMRLSEQSELGSVFKEANRNFKSIFSLVKKAGKKCETICNCTESIDLIRYLKRYPSDDPVP
jgi:hypothetical protein